MATEVQIQERINQALDAERKARVATVSVKLPPFWPDKTELWFAQAEAQFDIKGITVEKTKYSYVVSMLDTKTCEQAMDIIRRLPDNPHTSLKNRLKKAYELTNDERADRIIDMGGLGDRTPSQCLNNMLLLVPEAEAQDPGFLFRRIFLRQLPMDVRTQLAQTTKTGTTTTVLRELATEADKYFASTGSRVTSITAASASMATTESLVDTASEAEVFAVTKRGSQSNEPQGTNSGARGQRRQGQERRTFTMCYYHGRFGDAAKKCEQPCQFKDAKQSGNEQSGQRQAL